MDLVSKPALYSSSKFRGWLMVGIAFVEIFIICGPTYNFSIIFLSLQDEFNAGATWTGWIGSLANSLMGAAGLISMPLIQRYGPRLVTLVGLVAFGGGLVTTSLVPALAYAYVTFGVVVGLGANFVLQSVVHLLFSWFPEKNCSRAFSLVMLGTSFSELAFAPLLTTLIRVFAWRNALRIIGGGSIILGFVFAVPITSPATTTNHERGTRAKESRDEPCTDMATDAVIPDGLSENSRQRVLEVAWKIDTWLWSLCLVLVYLGWTFVTVNYASFMEHDLQFTTDQITIAIMMLAVGGIVGKILLSLFADRLPCLKLYVVAAASLLGAVVAGLMTWLRSVSLVYIVSLFVGSVRSASNAMPFPATMEIFGEYGSCIVSVLSMVPYGIGILIGAPISGSFYDLTGDYNLSLFVIVAIFVCSSAVALAIPIKKRTQLSSYSFSFRPKATKSSREIPHVYSVSGMRV
ncbi:monocarboxylate transporter 13-like [Acanthaster planci]|uniref:Monocarboxylate transporter 13-like n=1 Tax=Acanthaster planci TaxID=133434 RepID=A0A8B7YD58_ACAPL|nr:monocarboxylate transporter 13-like [Acanthaster planci]